MVYPFRGTSHHLRPEPPLRILLLLLALAAPLTARAEQRWVADAAYDPAIPSPERYLGRPLGSRHAEVTEILGYSRRLADASERVELVELGESVEGDPLVLLVITDPANRPLLERRTAALEIVVDPWTHDDDARAAALRDLLPATWIGCSVHGDEASGSDAGVMLAYHLAADESRATWEVLERSVVLIEPCQNPDGRRRFLNHIRSFRRQVPGPDGQPQAMEHTQLWPGGRRNHYLFDLNRDWAFVTQQESRARIAGFLRWRPQVMADLHEMGRESTYFFPPPTDPVNPNVPHELREWWDVFGRANAQAFDRHGYEYFVRESFDLFFPGYADSWTTLQGAVGMTFEQSTTRGLVLRNRQGDLLDYEHAVRRHFTAAWTTVETAAAHDRELLESYARHFAIQKERADAHPVRELWLSGESRASQAEALAQTLVRQGIRVERTTEPRRARFRAYVDGDTQTRTLPAGSFRVRLGQPAHGLLRSMLDLHTPMDEHFLAQERDRRERGLHDRFYDVTAWSLVLSYGVVAFESDRNLDVATEPVVAGVPIPGRLQTLDDSVPVAWVVPNDDNAALRALTRLLWRDVRVSLALDAFQLSGRELPRGSLVVKRSRNVHVDELDVVLAEIARISGADIWATPTGWTDAGPSLGSNRILDLSPPRIGLLSGPGTDPASVGAVRWILEERYGIPYTFMLVESVERAQLFEYDVLLVPQLRGNPALDLDRLGRWVEEGGTLITLGGATKWLLDEVDDWTTSALVRDLRELEAGGTAADEEDAEDADGPIPPEFRPERTPGAIVRLTLDPDHALTVGHSGEVYAPLLSDRLLRAPVEGTVLAAYADPPRVAGFMWPDMVEVLPGFAYAVHEAKGRGHLVLFAEDPSFRGTWEGLDPLLLNAVLLGKSLRP